MKNKLFTLFFLFVILSACERKTEILVAQSVPDTETFTLFDVLDALYGSHASGNLADAFAFSDAAKFDPAYGSKTMSPQTLLGFRNYGNPCHGTIYDDWSIPTSTELDLMYTNLHLQSIGGFSNVAYWSGTISGGYYIAIDFTTGTQYDRCFDHVYRIRAVRTFNTGAVNTYNVGDAGPSGGWIFSEIYSGGVYTYKECAAVGYETSLCLLFTAGSCQGGCMGTGQTYCTNLSICY